MYKDVQVVPYRVWVNLLDGRRVSVHGAAPWASPLEEDHWEIQTKGYTYACTDFQGNLTFGACGKPAETREEAERIALTLIYKPAEGVVHGGG